MKCARSVASRFELMTAFKALPMGTCWPRSVNRAGYIVSFLGRRALYFGRTAETHVEHF